MFEREETIRKDEKGTSNGKDDKSISSLSFIGRDMDQLVSGSDDIGHLDIWSTKTNEKIGRFNTEGKIMDVKLNDDK